MIYMAKKQFFLCIFLLMASNLTECSFRSFVSKACTGFRYGMRAWIGLVIEGHIGRHIKNCEHVKKMQDASPHVQEFVRNELKRIEILDPHLMGVKIDSDVRCVTVDPCVPKSSCISCGNCFLLFGGYDGWQELEELLQKESEGELTNADKERLDEHRYFVRQEGRAVANHDHTRLLASRLAIPALVLAGSHWLRTGIDSSMKCFGIDRVLESNGVTFSTKQITSTGLTLLFEFSLVLMLMKWYYQYQQKKADAQIDPSHTQPEIVRAAINHFKKLCDNRYERLNLGELFLSEHGADYQKRIEALEKNLDENYSLEALEIYDSASV